MTDEQKVTAEFSQAAYDFLAGLKEELAFGQIEKGEKYLALASIPKLHADPSVKTILSLCKNCDFLITVKLKGLCIPHVWEPFVETVIIDTYLYEKIGELNDITSPDFMGLYHSVQGALMRHRSAIDILRLIALRNNMGSTCITESAHGEFSVIADVHCDYVTFPKENVEAAIKAVLAMGSRFALADRLLREYLIPGAKSRNHDFRHLVERITDVEEKIENNHKDEICAEEEQEITI